MSDTVASVRQLDGAVVVDAKGEIDLRHQPAFQRELLRICTQKPRVLVLNLQDVTYMDSSGVGTLVKIAQTVKAYNGKLALVALQARVRSVFEITSLDKYFNILSTEEEALAQ